MSSDIDELKKHPAIIHLYTEHVKLKRDGKEMVGLCPLHSERTPSFRVRSCDDVLMWNCFGCDQRGGNIFQFLERKLQISFKQAADIVRKYIETSWDGNREKVESVFKSVGQEETKVQKTYSEQEYRRLEEALANNPEARAYLQRERGIDYPTAKRLRLGYRQDVGRLAGDSNADIANAGWISFPTFSEGTSGRVVTSVKYRSTRKKAFCKQSGMGTHLFNLESVDFLEPVYLVEGECLSGDTEVLTPSGWTRLDAYDSSPVAQWEIGGNSQFVTPLAYIAKSYTGDLVHFTSNSNLVDQMVTPEHRVIHCLEGRRGKKKEFDPVVFPAKDVFKSPRFFRTAYLEAAGVPLSDEEIRIQVMIQADGSVESRACDKLPGRHNSSGQDGWRLEVSKERKIARIKTLLQAARIPYKEYINGRGTSTFRFSTDPGKFHKIFPSDLYGMSALQKLVFIDEIRHWDSHIKPNGTVMYVSIIKANSDLVQTVFATSGLSAKMGIEARGGTCSDKYWVSVSTRSKRGNHHLTSGTTIRKTNVPFSGHVYCLQVPSSYLLIRRNNVISVTGNCDAAALEQAGFRAVSLPNAQSQVLPEWKDELLKAECVILAGDNDEAGIKLMSKLFKEMPRTYWLRWPGKCKDANQFFLEDCKRDIKLFRKRIEELVQQAKATPVEGIYDIKQSLLTATHSGTDNPDRLRFPWPAIDNMGIITPGTVTTIYSTDSGMGKTTWVLQASLYSAMQQNEVVINYQAEMNMQQIHTLVASHLLRKDRLTLVEEDYKKAAAMLGPNLKYYIGRNTSMTTVNEVLELIELAVKRFSGTVAILDNLHFLCRSESDPIKSQANAMQKITNMAATYNLKFILVHQARKADQNHKRKVTHVSDLDGSKAVQNDSSFVFSIHRDEIKHSKTDEVDNSHEYDPLTEIRLQKAREKGPGGSYAKLLFLGSLSTFSEITSEIEPNGLFT